VDGVNRLAEETSPTCASTRTTRRLVPVGRRGLRPSKESRQARPPLGRLLGLPLVPCDGRGTRATTSPPS
jgi:hypothetical protein